MTSTPRPIDFRRPRGPAPQVEQTLALWQHQTARLVSESWNRQLSQPVTMTAMPCESALARPAIGGLPEPGVGIELRLGAAQVPALLACPTPLILALVGDLLGTDPQAWPEPRNLTPVEESVLELLMRQFVAALGEAWPRQEPLDCELVRLAPRPSRSRMFAPEISLLALGFSFQTRFGSESAVCLLPQDATLTTIFGEQPRSAGPAPAMFTETLEQLARGIPLQIGVRLGEARLTMSQMANLRQGDVIILDQRINVPLTAHVGGVAKYTGHPGRSGPRQAFQIWSLVDAAASSASGRASAAAR